MKGIFAQTKADEPKTKAVIREILALNSEFIVMIW